MHGEIKHIYVCTYLYQRIYVPHLNMLEYTFILWYVNLPRGRFTPKDYGILKTYFARWW